MDGHKPEAGGDAQEKIREMVRRIVARFHPHKVILFGSHARGTADADSDVDLLVIMPVTGSRRRQVAAITVEVSGLGLAKDVIVATPEEIERYRHVPGTVFHPALREGKVLYDRAA